jgi:hypothetical protein
MSLHFPLKYYVGGSCFFILGAFSFSLQALILGLSAASNPLAAKELASNTIDPAFEQQVLGVIRRNPAVMIEALKPTSANRKRPDCVSRMSSYSASTPAPVT